MSHERFEDQLRAAFKTAWDEYASHDLAAIDEITNMMGLNSAGDLIRYLRSDEPISRLFRDVMADALESGKLRIVRARGRPRSDRQRLLQRVKQVDIALEVRDRKNKGQPEKAAVDDVAKSRGISQRTVREAMRLARGEALRVKSERSKP